MRINNNMSAVITNNQLLGTESSLSDVMEKLSSGFNINHASDNPSGIAIAGKMQAQIDGLNKASTNADDGISVLQTAEGALGEVTDMLQRMRELSVQAANGTNAESERASIQMEIKSLLQEIDRISTTTEFNTINLLDGSLDNRTYAEHCSRIQTSDTVAAGTYKLSITATSVQANIRQTAKTAETFQQKGPMNLFNEETIIDVSLPDSNTSNNIIDFINNSTYVNTTNKYKYKEGELILDTNNVENGTGLAIAGTISINGYDIVIPQGSTGEQVYEKLRVAAEYGGASISDPNELLSITSIKFGADANLDIQFSSVDFARALGFSEDDLKDEAGNVETAKNLVGTDAEVTLKKKYDINNDRTDSDFGMQATTKYDGNKITVTDTNGFEISFLAETGYIGDITFNVTDIGSMTLQVGANEGQTMDVRIRSTSTEAMYIDDINVVLVTGADDAMTKLDGAIDYITSIRSQLGAYENRLEHTTKSLDETSENMTSAISRIEDADMATTMVEYTRLNVLEQAATSALAQANELPQLALQLLQ